MCRTNAQFNLEASVAQISANSRSSSAQVLANCSSLLVSDFNGHFFLNQEVAPVRHAATGQGVFRLQREEARCT